MAWALAQAVSLILFFVWQPAGAPPKPPVTPLVVGALVLSAVALVLYFLVGMRLRALDPRVRVPAIVLSILALFSLPLGTAIGIYGLWTLFKHRTAGVHA